MTGRTYRNLAVAVAVIGLIIGVAASGSAQKKGGVVRVGNLGEPPRSTPIGRRPASPRP